MSQEDILLAEIQWSFPISCLYDVERMACPGCTRDLKMSRTIASDCAVHQRQYTATALI